MMAKAKSIYTCNECGGTSPKWAGPCPGRRAWNTLFETLAEAEPRNRFSGTNKAATLQLLSDVRAKDSRPMPTGIAEFDRVLGGGLVAGQVVLIGGDPGVGKSTLLLQALTRMGVSSRAVYVSGEG